MQSSRSEIEYRVMARPTRTHRMQLFLAIAIATVAALPIPALAATAPVRLMNGESSRPAVVNRWSLDARVDEHPADRPMVIRGNVPVWRFEARLAALEAIAARRAAEAAAATEAAAAKAPAVAPSHVGKNHLWIPTLGLSRSIRSFACTRSTPPTNYVYRWGCAGKNNVYLFGHAWGVMKPLHDGYLSGKVKVGMKLLYADGSGRVRTYRVTEIRIVTPDQVSWAIAAQPVASMTLQTCLGATNEKRLLVRLVADT